MYAVDGAPTLANQKLNMLRDDESSDDECLRCENKRLNCSDSQPCFRCVKDHQNPDKHVSCCNWRRRGGLLERYMVEPYALDDEGRAVLKEDHAGIVAAARTRGRLSSAAATAGTNEKRKSKRTISGHTVDSPSQQSESGREEDGPIRVAMTVKSDQRLPDPQTFKEAMKSDEASLWLRAIEEEKACLEEKHTWNVVPIPKGSKPITSRIIFKRKYGPDGDISRHKARLVARGFQQEEGIDFEETFAAVVKPASYRILFAIANTPS